MKTTRWQMNRAGMFNFWLFTDDVFQLSDGRIIFRGANGAGKSVTMQSFLPLVLDGDKRPSRLDPFGSKDRKIEYYLLGDGESGNTDKTAYVYLEFLQPDTGKTLTLGIGLRARRGAAQVNFWGFSLTDGRRVGIDFFLYDRMTFEREGEKIPLDRTGLEAALGEGGRVVREQGEYRKMVNQLLFGFEDVEGFKDLLALMIQLRSPKLSKEFRPSTIYSILNEALPPLGEDELKPLSDVLQDMDEISDRLDELQMHRDAAERLDKAYHRYNQMRLYDLSKLVNDAARAVDTAALEVRQEDEAWVQSTAAHEQLSTQLAETEAARDRAEAELESLEHSEAMGVQKELEAESGRLNDSRGDMANTEKRMATSREDAQRKRVRMDQAERDVQQQLDTQAKRLREMDELASEVEFADHVAYANSLRDGGQELGHAVWASWRKDVEAYRALLEQSRVMCSEERRAHEKVQDAERQMSEARARRDACEVTVQAKEKELESAIQVQEDALFAWYKRLSHLPLSQEAWLAMVHTLRQYPSRPYADALEPARSVRDKARDKAQSEQLQIEHLRGLKQADRAKLQEELDAWKNTRNPEPNRSEARQRTRQKRMESHGEEIVGAPLYMLCEFRADVDEPTRAALETALHAAGLLDAWVSPHEVTFEDGDEEVMLRPTPLLFGYTLADYLEPTPPDGCGLTAQQVEDVLRTVRIGDRGDDGQAYITAEGQYCLGPLIGRVVSKPCAEWIGFEARKRSRLAAVERLRAAIETLDGEIAETDRELHRLAVHLEHIEAEMRGLPSDESLKAALDAHDTARRDFQHATQVEQECTSRFREQQVKWREIQQKVVELTARWQTLKQEDDFQQALGLLRDYERALGECRTSHELARRSRVDVELLQSEIEVLEERLDADDLHLREVRNRTRLVEDKIQSLRQLLQDLGVLDVYQKQQELKNALSQWKQSVKHLQEQVSECRVTNGKIEERLNHKRSALGQCESRLQASSGRFHMEWGLRLVRFEESDGIRFAELSTDTAVLRAARDVQRAYKSRCESRNLQQVSQQLQDVFAIEKNTLLDYALASRFDADLERVFVESTRDRNRPTAPYQMLEELSRLVEEQRILISDKDRELYEQILIHSVGRAIRDKINRAEQWVEEMNHFMAQRKTSSGLVLALQWTPKAARNERELDTEKLVHLLRKSPNTLHEEEMEQMIEHFRSRIRFAKEEAEEGETLRKWISELLDYRSWFSFTLYFRKGSQPRRELTDSQFNVLSGGEKAMAMYIPLFAATDSRYKDSKAAAPRIISLDEAFAGVDDENMRDMFQLLTDMEFDYMMTSQQLWGCYDTVPSLSIYEIFRPLDADFVTLMPYYWNGHTRKMVHDGDWDAMKEVAATNEAY